MDGRELDEAARAALQRRTLVVVVVCQVFGGAGLAAGVTVGALLAQDMLGGAALAGLPAALFTLGSALAAYTVGRVSHGSGRRTGLAAGFLAGALGALGVVVAAVVDSPVLLFAALFVYGAGTATNLQARYAATDLAPEHRRATAASLAMVATTFGAVAGPNSVELTGRLAERFGIPALAGPFALAGLAFALAGAVLFVFLRPDPLLVARALAAPAPAPTPVPTPVAASVAATADPDRAADGAADPPLDATDATDRRMLMSAATVMVITQVAMVAIMTMTPVHMRHHGHGLGEVGFVIGVHIAAMFLPSPLTGMLVDRVGRIPMVAAAGLTLLLSGVVAAFAPGDSLGLLTLSLALLGLGWNFGLISGTALVVDATPLATRARAQGTLDVLVALAGASGGAASGWVVAGTDYPTLALGGGLLALLLLPAVGWAARTSTTVARHPTEEGIP